MQRENMKEIIVYNTIKKCDDNIDEIRFEMIFSMNQEDKI
jgi:hypothetical protein